MQPSTLSIKLLLFWVVICSTAKAKFKVGVFGKCCKAYSLMIDTRLSGFSSDFNPMPDAHNELVLFLALGHEI